MDNVERLAITGVGVVKLGKLSLGKSPFCQRFPCVIYIGLIMREMLLTKK